MGSGAACSYRRDDALIYSQQVCLNTAVWFGFAFEEKSGEMMVLD